MYIISRCLLGSDCKYDGGDNYNEDVTEFSRTHDYVTVCPEVAGGLGTPRTPAEIVPVENGYFKVMTRDGADVTREFDYGAELSLQSVLVEHGSRRAGTCSIEGAILKANSPSCGSGVIYDGTFTHTRVCGNGVFTDKLIDACLEERSDQTISEDRRAFSEDFRICDENNCRRVFGGK